MNLYPPRPAAASRPAGLQALLAFAIATALFLAVHGYRDIRMFSYDADFYWQLADLPRFTSVTNNIRGYVLAVMLAPARYLSEAAQSYWPLRLYLSLAYAWGLTWLVPQAYTALFGGRLSLARRLVPAVLAALIFPGLLVYPLSDLPALLLMLGSLLALRTASRHAGAAGLPLRWVALAGALAGAAYNVRTIYLFLLVGALLAVFLIARQAPWRRQTMAAAVFAVSAFVMLLPQGLLNQKMHGRFSFNPVIMGDGQSLFVVQLVAGLGTQRYETMVLPQPSSSAAIYRDPAGARLLAEVGGSAAIRSPRDYIARVVLARPLDFAALMGRHVVNGLDARDGMLYLRRFSASRNGMAVLNFAVLAASAWVGALLLRRRASSAPAPLEPAPRWRWWLALWLAPVAFILPGMVETRFFAPLHLLAWCTLAFHFDRRALADSLKEHPLLIPGALLAAACVFFAVTLSTMAQGPA